MPCRVLRYLCVITLLPVAFGCATRAPHAPATDDLSGHWEGAIALPFGAAPVLLDITRFGGDLRAWVSIRGTRTGRDTGEPVVVANGKFEVAFTPDVPKSTPWRLRGELRDGRLRGECVIPNSDNLAFSLGREILPAAHLTGVPQTPREPWPYDSAPVYFWSGGITRAGTITRPRGPGPHPAVFLIQGGGGADRDYTGGDHRPFLVLADALTRAGAVVLRADSRGFGGSGGSDQTTTLDEHVGDVAEAVAFLAAQPDVDRERVTVVGASRGGVIALTSASRLPAIKSVILLSSPVRPLADVALDQWEAAKPDRSPDQRALVGKLRPVLRRAMLAQGALPSARELADDEILNIIDQEMGAVGDAERVRTLAYVRAALPPSANPGARSFYGYDPARVLPNVRGSVHAVFGSHDEKLNAELESRALADALLPERSRPDAIVIVDGVDHTLAFAKSEPRAWMQETVHPKVLALVIRWVTGRAP